MKYQTSTTDRIAEFFRAYAPVGDVAWAFFKQRLGLHNYLPGDIIHSAGQHCTRLCFILEGVARSYLQKTDGRDFTWFFHYNYENSSPKHFIMLDYPSFTLHAPSTYGFQALSRCCIACISYQGLTEVFQEYPEFLSVEKQLVVNAYQKNNLRLQSLLTKSAKGRLDEFEQEEGMLFDMIPHYHIASFLGMTPQRLSQLRRNEPKKNIGNP
jgi:CRP-like cAMP-binding protein